MDTTTPLTDREAERVRTVLKQRKGKELLLRELRMFSPEEIAKTFNLNAGEVARMANRKNEEKRKP